MKSRITALTAASLVTLVALTACNGIEAPSDNADGDLTSLSYISNFSINGGDSYLYYGIDQGFFAAEGIDLEIIPGKTAQTAIDTVLAGDAEFGRTAGTNIILSAAQGQNVTSVGAVYEKSGFGFIIPEANAGAGLAGLEGKQVLSVSGGPNNSIAPIVLENEGIDPASVELVNLSPTALLSTFIGGQGDALLTAVQFGLAMTQGARPSQGFLFADYGVNIPDYSYVVAPEFLEENPELVAGFLRAVYKSYDAAIADPEAAAAVLEREVPTVLAGPATIGQFLAYDQFRCLDGDEGTPVGVHDADQWADAVDVFVEAGLIGKGDVDPESLYTNTFFEDGSVDGGSC